MKTYMIENEHGEEIECIEVDHNALRRYYGNPYVDICRVCPAYQKFDVGGTTYEEYRYRCSRLADGSQLGCPVDEVLMPLTDARRPAFVAALLEE
jgi:hypothetical protein